MQPKISFLLPCYNVERYVEDCLRSITAQGLEDSEYEIVCLNDVSTDSTAEVIQNFINLPENAGKSIKFVTLEKNGGLANARNEAYKYATGEYIWWIDSDDMLAKGSVGKAMHVVEMLHPDVTFGGYCRIENSESFGSIYSQGTTPPLDGPMTESLGSAMSNRGGYCVDYQPFKADDLHQCAPFSIETGHHREFAVCAIYKKSFLDKHCVKFDKELRISEDLDFYCFFPHNFKAVRLDCCLYLYRKNPNSLLLASDAGRLQKGYKAFVHMYKKYVSQNPHNLNPEEMTIWRNRMSHNIASCLVRVPDRQYVREQLQYLRKEGIYPYKVNKEILGSKVSPMKKLTLLSLPNAMFFNLLNIIICRKSGK